MVAANSGEAPLIVGVTDDSLEFTIFVPFFRQKNVGHNNGQIGSISV